MELVGTLEEHCRIAHSYNFAVANYILANEVLDSLVGYCLHILVIGTIIPSEYGPYDVVGDGLSFAFKVTVPQFGHIARLSGISFPHRSQVVIMFVLCFRRSIVIAENHSISVNILM